MILNAHWRQEIEDTFDGGNAINQLFREDRGEFLDTIWNLSLTAFDTPREIQVVIDSNNKLFIDYGSASFVSFKDNDSLTGMKLPIKCWIHTHPFGQAYFSGTDMRTINTWKVHMLSAIVLGDGEHQLWMKPKPNQAKHITYSKVKIIKLGDEEE